MADRAAWLQEDEMEDDMKIRCNTEYSWYMIHFFMGFHSSSWSHAALSAIRHWTIDSTPDCFDFQFPLLDVSYLESIP